MSRRMLIAAATTVLAALLLAATVTSGAGAAPRPGGRAVVVLAPYLSWTDIVDGPMPATRAVAEAGLVADLNVRSGTAGSSGPSLEHGALLLSAGASVLSDGGAAVGYTSTESVDGTPVGDLYERVYGHSPGAAQVLYLGTPRQARANEQALSNAVIGSLGEAVRGAGGVTVALGNSDPGSGVRPELWSRPAAIVAADTHGIVDLGDVSTSLLTTDALAPYGVRTDTAALIADYRGIEARLDGSRPSLVVLDSGDLARAIGWSSNATTPTAEAQRKAALASVDRIVGAVAASLHPDDVLMVLAPAVMEVPDRPSSFAPLIAQGPGLTGLARTASTHRDGICTVMDVPATLLGALGIAVPESVVGAAMTGSGANTPLVDRVDTLAAMDNTAVAVEQVRAGAINWFITITVAILFGATLLLIRGGPEAPAPIWSAARAALVFAPCIPLAGLLQFLVWGRPATAGWVVGLLVGTCVVLWAGAMALGRGRVPTMPLIAVTGLTTLTLMLDPWFGAPLSFAGLFGYAPLYGARYYGIGNEMAGLLLGASMVCVALVLDTWRDARWAPALRKWGWPVMGAIVLGTTAAPPLGANIGAVAWMTVGFGAGWLMLNGKRVWTWRNAVVLVLLVAVIVGALAAMDILGGAGQETHLGRAVSNATGQGGAASFLTLVARKAETNIRVLGRTNWTWLLVAVLLLLGYMRWRPRGEFAAMLKSHPAFSAVLGAALFAGVVGNFTEDSGVIIPALVMLPVGVTALFLMLDESPRKPSEGA